MKVKYRLIDLSCANCAAKIEKKVQALPGVQTANINLINQELMLEVDSGIEAELLLEAIQSIVKAIEPDVVVEQSKNRHLTEGIVSTHEMSNHDGVSNDSNEAMEDEKDSLFNPEIIKILAALMLFVIGLGFFQNHFLYLPIMILSYLIVGGEIVLRAIKNLLQKNLFDENFLMTLATVGAFAIGEYPEAVAVMWLYQVGEYFQDLAVERSRASIRKLMEIKPEVANVMIDDQIHTMAVEKVAVGSKILIKPGERVPLDSIILSGEGLIDMKALTGESLPVFVGTGEQILSGCINLNGVLTAEVVKTSQDSMVNKILELVENAAGKKAKTEKFITKFARYYTPIVTILAALIALIPPLLFQDNWQEWLSRSFVFLVISCPCALVISIPLGYFAGIGRASKSGILIKGGNYLEALNQIDIAVFDKTGTLTKGNFKVTQVIPEMNFTVEDVLRYASHVESFSTHPIAKSIVSAYLGEVDQTAVENIVEISVNGVKGRVFNQEVIVGNRKLMEQENIKTPLEDFVGTCIYVALNGTLIGRIMIQDEIKENAKATLTALNQLGIKKTVMISGDHLNVAAQVGNTLGIDAYYGETLPKDKLNIVEELAANGKVLYVGDGINDTPVLARADLGVAMGGLGSDSAIEVSDMVIMNDDLSKLVTAKVIAKKTNHIVWENIVFALGIKFAFLVLGALGLTSLWAAVFADVGVALLAVLNSLRILWLKNNIYD